MTQSISLLLTTYNRTSDCIVCMGKLLEQKTNNIEIILLDEYHYSDQVLEIYCEKREIKYVHTGAQKRGRVHWRVPGFALNIGAKLAQGDYLILGCAEMYHVSENTIQKMDVEHKITYPRIWDEPEKITGKFTKYNRLNGKYPFCLGIPKDVYYDIGGYDEDFTGYCFDDADFSDRAHQALLPENSIEIDADIIHLWNVRGGENRGDPRLKGGRAWQFNKRLYEERDTIVRNENRIWGVL